MEAVVAEVQLVGPPRMLFAGEVARPVVVVLDPQSGPQDLVHASGVVVREHVEALVARVETGHPPVLVVGRVREMEEGRWDRHR
jgi:hypothetical protein